MKVIQVLRYTALFVIGLIAHISSLLQASRLWLCLPTCSQCILMKSAKENLPITCMIVYVRLNLLIFNDR